MFNENSAKLKLLNSFGVAPIKSNILVAHSKYKCFK